MTVKHIPGMGEDVFRSVLNEALHRHRDRTAIALERHEGFMRRRRADTAGCGDHVKQPLAPHRKRNAGTIGDFTEDRYRIRKGLAAP